MTSASETPSAWAASAGLRSSGGACRGRRSRPRHGHSRRGMATHEAVLHHLLRQTEADGELRRRARGSATATAFESLPHLILHEVVQIPTAAMLDRLSIACSTSGGTDTFSTMKLPISMPYFVMMAGLMSGSSASPSSV